MASPYAPKWQLRGVLELRGGSKPFRQTADFSRRESENEITVVTQAFGRTVRLKA
jgi:hypothetical protein